MNFTKKQIAWALGFITLIILMGWAIYAVFLRPLLPVEPILPEEVPIVGEGLPGAGVGGPKPLLGIPGETPGLALAPDLPEPAAKQDQESYVSDVAVGGPTRTKALTDKPSYSVTLSGDKRSLNFYDRESAQFYRVNDQGQSIKLSDKQFYEVQEANWAPNKNETIMEFPDGNKLYYNFQTDKQVTLPSHWDDFSFAPSSGEMAFKSITDSVEDNWMAISSPDGSSPEAIQPLGANGNQVTLSWSPNNQVIGMFTKPISNNKQEVYFLGRNDENFKLAVVEGRDFRPNWFPDGSKMLYSVYNSNDNFNPSLWVVDAVGDTIGENRVPLEVNTWADRCTFNRDGSSLYCSRPKDIPAGAGLFPDLLTRRNVPSELIKVNTVSGGITILGEPETSMDIAQVFVNDAEDKLFFQNSQDLTIQSMRIK
ncbi:MAG: hypothetical protein G01um101418_347 [Parcubacteria group bacterium Gr01-1014_18]|nr:MAG: hypothetical protein Greene041636_277 [Parcubacteria group bacterium Greene0416_36]TSC81207.1 MAG: hypothetical protein G01um101418_347 [Parcubacteria group bacterium Gr01-1014_18]TSC99204.1 MAG: hypothetical protein Greene101420_349 [Parcubacteria group bacterium Greene1014_20]TSD07438.1 MAG: hypothetical protein Greene07142_137 [Parcubacteria group bacterium Greene0714_2]